MEDTKQLRDAFDAAHEFLDPVLKRDEIRRSRGDSLLEILSLSLPKGDHQSGPPRTLVIDRALNLLVSIHHAFIEPVSSSQDDVISRDLGREQETLVEDARRRRTLHGLLDLLSFEGIYPSLSPGVGIPLAQRVMSVLPAGVVAKQEPIPSGEKSEYENLLQHIMGTLRSILRDDHPSIQPIVLGRILPDIICGAAELAFNPQCISPREIETYKDMFHEIINETSTPSLLPVLSSFLQSSSAEWFKSQISYYLSRVPLRNDGVFQTILFIASQFAPTLGHDTQPSTTNGPPITVQAIMHISRLLSSIPKDMSADEYFANLAPKLLSLLDGEDLDLKKTSSYVIGNGILAKRAYGAPGTVGHTIFVLPIFEALNAKLTNSSAFWLQRFSPDGSVAPQEPKRSPSDSVLVDEGKLLLALDRLNALALSHPNPGLLKRLVGPVLIQLWGLQCYATEHGESKWSEKISAPMQTFFSMSAPGSRFKRLIDHVLWDGGPCWTYGSGQEGGISLKMREDTGSERINLVHTIEVLGDRIDTFLALLAADPQREEVTGDIFLYVSRQWLLNSAEETDGTQVQASEDDVSLQGAMKKLISAKFAEKLLALSKDTLSRHPLKVLEIINQLLESEVSRGADAGAGPHRLDRPSIQSIANIATKDEAQHDMDSGESSESLAAGFSLLSTILTSPDFQISQSVLPILQTLKQKLDTIASRLPSHLVHPATTASMLLEITISDPLSSGSRPAPTDVSSHVSQLQTHRQALSNISSPLPPVQAEGLSLLSNLITESSPVLDIPSTLTLLISLISTDDESAANDEFVYLNVIKVIGLLASRHPRSVVKSLAERYADRSEEATVDQRLKIGEALLRTAQELGPALVWDAAKTLGETMVAIAGRRESKPKAKKEREELAQHSISEIPDETLADEDDPETEDPAQAAYSQKILEAWAAGATSDESPDDLRVRSSAMSILASAIQTNLAGIGRSLASASIDLALSTLTLEPGPECAILRRAAVVLLVDLVKAFDNARENGSDLGFGFSFTSGSTTLGPSSQNNGTTIGNVPEILRVVRFVESKETDAIVRGHIRVLVENLETWTENYLLWGIRDRESDDDGPRFELGDRLAGLDIQPPSAGDGRSRPRIEEIE